HALLIGINDYPRLRKLKGAVSDVHAMRSFLVNYLDVPDDGIHIRTLLDADATRDNIISSVSNLSEDPHISKDDPILIFYAGYGSTLLMPTTKWSTDSSEVQCLVAYDAAHDSTGKYVEGVIPDFTLGSLLCGLGDAKGNNITVILDC
ncbi:hypothetical protein K488DRAFT_30944, partial [Vararia minispora EC-137]